MDQITWNKFIELCSNKNISFLGSINKDIDYVKNIIDINLNKIEINYNRIILVNNGNNIKFLVNDNNIFKTSILDKKGKIYFYKECYLIKQDFYTLVYKINNDHFIDFRNLFEDKKKKKERSIILKNKYLKLLKKYNLHKKKLEIKKYFNHKIWDQNMVKKLTFLQFANIKKILDKKFLYSGIVKTFKENLETRKILGKKTTKKSINYKYLKSIATPYNSNYNHKQKEYLEKIAKSKIYIICYDEDFIKETSKNIYDLIVICAPGVGEENPDVYAPGVGEENPDVYAPGALIIFNTT